jgi:O-antigen ligase
MFSATIHSRIHFILSCLIAFLLPFKTVVPLVILVLSLNWLLEGDFRAKFTGLQHRFVFFCFIGFYFYHVIGMTWTTNIPAGWFDLQVKLSLLAFPLIYGTRPVQAQDLNRILICFVLGCSTAALAVLIRAGIYYVGFGENRFYYTGLSWFMHPSYFAMYLNASLLFILLSFVSGARPKGLWWLLIPLHLVTIALLSSKLGLISVVVLLFSGVCWIIIRQKKLLLGGGLIALLALSIWSVFHFSPTVSTRIRTAFRAVSSDGADKGNAESTAVRMLIWKAATELIQEHPWAGSGTGDSKETLMEKYKSEGIAGAYAHNLNAHNAYLQVWVALGIGGFLLLLAIQVFPFLEGIRSGNVFLCGFILLIILNFLPESMLETQAGSTYYGFFNSLLLFSPKPSCKLEGPRKSWFQ